MTIHLLARTCTVSGILLAAFSLCPIAQAQNGAPNPVFTQPGGQVNTTASVDFNTPPPDPAHEHMLRKMVKERNMIRQQTIVDDTNHLLDLAKQLKDEIGRASCRERV